MSPEETDYLLEEWAHWQRSDPSRLSWPPATPFGRLIVPDPAPPAFAVDVERALLTDRVLARLPRRYRFLVRMYYLDRAPIESKARRMRMGRRAYEMLMIGVRRVIGVRLTEALDQPRKSAKFGQAARGVGERPAAP